MRNFNQYKIVGHGIIHCIKFTIKCIKVTLFTTSLISNRKTLTYEPKIKATICSEVHHFKYLDPALRRLSFCQEVF